MLKLFADHVAPDWRPYNGLKKGLDYEAEELLIRKCEVKNSSGTVGDSIAVVYRYC